MATKRVHHSTVVVGLVRAHSPIVLCSIGTCPASIPPTPGWRHSPKRRQSRCGSRYSSGFVPARRPTGNADGTSGEAHPAPHRARQAARNWRKSGSTRKKYVRRAVGEHGSPTVCENSLGVDSWADRGGRAHRIAGAIHPQSWCGPRASRRGEPQADPHEPPHAKSHHTAAGKRDDRPGCRVDCRWLRWRWGESNPRPETSVADMLQA